MTLYNYAKLTPNGIAYATSPLIIDGRRHWTNDPAVLTAAGYSPVVREPMPQGGDYRETYTLTDGVIHIGWAAVPAPEPEPEILPTLEERVGDCEDALLELAAIITEV